MTADRNVKTPADDGLTRWRELTDLPLLVLAFTVIPLLLLDYIGNQEAKTEDWIDIAYTVIWACFVTDFIVEISLATDKRDYLRHEWPELVVNVLTVPLFFLTWLPQWLQILRSTRLLRILRGVRLGALTYRGGRRAVSLPKGRNAQLLIATIVFATIVLLSAVLEYAVEADASGQSDQRIATMGDAIWWSTGTLTTIGYGDVVPQTPLGRAIALLPMIAAVGFVGVVAANLASRLFRGVQERLGSVTRTAEEELLAEVVAKLEQLDARLDRIEAGTSMR
jgi:voltage-gated potassium channel